MAWIRWLEWGLDSVSRGLDSAAWRVLESLAAGGWTLSRKRARFSNWDGIGFVVEWGLDSAGRGLDSAAWRVLESWQAAGWTLSRQRARFSNWDGIGFVGRTGAGFCRQRTGLCSLESFGIIGKLRLDSSAGRELVSPTGMALDSLVEWGLDSAGRGLDSAAWRVLESLASCGLDSSAGRELGSPTGMALDSLVEWGLDSAGRGLDSAAWRVLESLASWGLDSSAGRELGSPTGMALDLL